MTTSNSNNNNNNPWLFRERIHRDKGLFWLIELVLTVPPGLSVPSHAHPPGDLYRHIYFLVRKAHIAIRRGPHEEAGKSLGPEKPSRVERSFAKKILNEGRGEGRGGGGREGRRRGSLFATLLGTELCNYFVLHENKQTNERKKKQIIYMDRIFSSVF